MCSLEERKISLVLAKCNKTLNAGFWLSTPIKFLTSSFADVSSLVLADVVIPVAVVNIYRQAVFTVKIIWVTCEETRHLISTFRPQSQKLSLHLFIFSFLLGGRTAQFSKLP